MNKREREILEDRCAKLAFIVDNILKNHLLPHHTSVALKDIQETLINTVFEAQNNELGKYE